MVAGELRNPENAERICKEIASGVSLRDVAKGLGCDESSIREWVLADPEFSPRYARARELQADHYADSVLTVARCVGMEYEDRRIEIDALKWTAGKLKPKSYGDSKAVDITSGGQVLGKAIVGVNVEDDI